MDTEIKNDFEFSSKAQRGIPPQILKRMTKEEPLKAIDDNLMQLLEKQNNSIKIHIRDLIYKELNFLANIQQEAKF